MGRSLFALLLLGACTPVAVTPSPPGADAGASGAVGSDAGFGSDEAPNILLVIADDLGADVAPCMAASANRVPMPNVEALCARGRLFTATWSNPTCSPSRATMLTGRYGFRTGVGEQILGNQSAALPESETSLPQLLKGDSGVAYASAVFGKWHLSNAGNGGANHPEACGFDAYAGLLSGAHRDYFSWNRTENGRSETVTTYATTAIADDAVAWLAEQNQPWFLWLAFTAPHTPLHLPPANLHSQTGLSGSESDVASNREAYYGAAAEALDSEMGRVIEAIGTEALANTWVIFVGDNGTPGQVIPSPRSRTSAKNTLYEGGVHVPLVIAGPGVAGPGTTVDAPVNLVDLHRTIAELAGRDSATIDGDRVIDSVSLLPYLRNEAAPDQRTWAYSELFGTSANTSVQGRTARERRYKLIQFDQGAAAFFDLQADPYEANNLLEGSLDDDQQAAHDRLDDIIFEVSGRP
jgi:arylsulfatase B